MKTFQLKLKAGDGWVAGLLCTLIWAGHVQADDGSATAATGTLLVANRSSHDISFIDTENGTVIDSVVTGEGPHLLSNVSNGRVLATGYGEFPRPHDEPVDRRPPFVSALNSRISLIDTTSRDILFDTVLENCLRPHASWIIGQRGYVTCETEQAVQVISLIDGKLLERLPTQQSGSHVLSFEPATRTLGVSNVDSGSLTLIGVDDGETTVVKLSSGSEGALVVSGEFWVANTGDGSVSIVDPQTATEVTRIGDVCAFPIAFSSNQLETVWLACFGSAELVAIDRRRREIQARFSLSANPLHVLLHPQRDVAYVSYPRQNAVGEIDLASGKELRRFNTGIEPDGLRWAAAR